MVVSINQRLDAEAIIIIAHELNKEVKLTTIDQKEPLETTHQETIQQQIRPPIVTIMGHVDHGKTSLLDYIRKTKITEQEAGGITQQIGAYDIRTKSGDSIIFLDTPGHEAFTAMRARGTQVTDIAIIIIAADDGVMPQTKEAISHIQQAGLPIVIAINKIDKPDADPDKVRQALAQLNITVEEWGGKYQTQEISAKTGTGVEELLEKILLEAEMLQLKANPNKKAQGTIIEATLEKERGYLVTAIVQEGTLKKGDIILAGSHFGKIKAMFTAQGKPIKQASPSTPVQLLGLNGAPHAGQKFRTVQSDREARTIANKHQTIFQEQKLRAQQGNLIEKMTKELLSQDTTTTLNLVIKADTQGAAEALADAFLKLNTEETTINIILKSVGSISESDILLASSTNATIIGFHITLTPPANKINEKEQVPINIYDVIYHAIDYVQELLQKKDEPTQEEVSTGEALVLKIFEISRVGTIAGCQVKKGTIRRSDHVHVVRNGEIIHTGPIKQLKREKEVIKEAKEGTECGIHIDSFHNIKEKDIIQSFEPTR